MAAFSISVAAAEEPPPNSDNKLDRLFNCIQNDAGTMASASSACDSACRVYPAHTTHDGVTDGVAHADTQHQPTLTSEMISSRWASVNLSQSSSRHLNSCLDVDNSDVRRRETTVAAVEMRLSGSTLG